MATTSQQHYLVVISVFIAFAAISIPGSSSSSSSSSDDDDRPNTGFINGSSSSSSSCDDKQKNYTCNVGNACDVDSDQPFAYLEGFLYCCRENDVISFTVNFDVKAALPKVEAINMSVSEKVQEGFKCTCLDLGKKDLKERIRETFDDVKDKVEERWDDAKDWLDDIF